MRIISGFRDYYDVVQAQGQDQSLIYQRKRVAVTLGRWPFPTIDRHWNCRLYVGTRVIGFCGRIYLVLRVEAEQRHFGAVGPTVAVCHNIDDVDAFARQVLSKKGLENYLKPAGKHRRVTERDGLISGFAEYKLIAGNFPDLFAQHRTPIFVARRSKTNVIERTGFRYECILTLNDNLKEQEFYRIIPTAQAFQELSMYLGSQAQPEKPIPYVSDKDMLEAKGFDKKWSFRKEPTKRKR